MRFIPAYAGNSRPQLSGYRRHSVHPRLRGELYLHYYGNGTTFGSSPLTRGTQDIELEGEKYVRFIPAYAGNSRYSINRRPYTIRFIPAYAGNSAFLLLSAEEFPVHPRLRGELIRVSTLLLSSLGSSPLTRGTHALLIYQDCNFRFIPAYAGNSYQSFFMKLFQYGSSPLTRGTRDLRAG